MNAYHDRSGRLVRDTGGTARARIVAEYPDPARPGTVVTVDEHGAGPAGAWWTHLVERPTNGIGITPELPSGRACAWNLAGLAVQAAAIWWAHAEGNTWTTIAAALGAVLLLGVGLLAYVITVHTPRAIRRHHALLRALADAALDPVGESTGPDDTSTGRAA
jgi:hypothetical protein